MTAVMFSRFRRRSVSVSGYRPNSHTAPDPMLRRDDEPPASDPNTPAGPVVRGEHPAVKSASDEPGENDVGENHHYQHRVLRALVPAQPLHSGEDPPHRQDQNDGAEEHPHHQPQVEKQAKSGEPTARDLACQWQDPVPESEKRRSRTGTNFQS